MKSETKQAIYKWRANHEDEYKTLQKKYCNEWYEKNKKNYNSNRIAKRAYIQEWKRLCNILLEV